MSRYGQRGKKPAITSRMYQNHHTVLAYLYPNCSRIAHEVYPICIGMKLGKAAPNPALRGRAKSPMMFQIIHECSGHLSLLVWDVYPSTLVKRWNTIVLNDQR